MGMTVTEKILARAAGREYVKPGDIVNVQVDNAMIHDNNGPMAIKQFGKLHVDKVWDQNKVFFVIDHHSPATTIKAAEHQATIREFVQEQGIKHFYDCGNGVSHTLMLEQGHVKPGQIIVGSDSHTTAQGALGAFATGIGSTDMAGVLATGQIWFQVPETILINITGDMPAGIDARDVISAVLKDFGPSGANYRAIEFTGEVVEKFDTSEKATLCAMCLEMGAKNAIIIPANLEPEEKAFLTSDPDAKFFQKLNYNVSQLEPLVACPSLPTNIKPVNTIGKIPVNQATIASCAGGSLRDIAVAANILKGRQVHQGVRFLVVPSSKKIYNTALAKGYFQILHDAGAIISSPACGTCAGYEIGALAPGETCISSTTRNMPGRMGPGGQIYLASAATVAASAVAGYICDPRQYLGAGC